MNKNITLEKTRYSDKERFGGNRKLALERDSYTCQKCGMTNYEHIAKWNREITVDHIDGNGRYSKIKNNDLDNLATLCLVCHGNKDVKRRKHTWSKLTEEQVREIKEKYSDRKTTCKKIGEIYGISGAAIRDILANRYWKNINGED